MESEFHSTWRYWCLYFIQHGDTGVFICQVVWCLVNGKFFREVEFWLASFRFTLIYQLDSQKTTSHGYTDSTSDLTVVICT